VRVDSDKAFEQIQTHPSLRIPNHLCFECKRCSRKFEMGWIDLKVSCDNCGEVFCQNCCKHYVHKDRRYGYSGQLRVCETCFFKLRD